MGGAKHEAAACGDLASDPGNGGGLGRGSEPDFSRDPALIPDYPSAGLRIPGMTPHFARSNELPVKSRTIF